MIVSANSRGPTLIQLFIVGLVALVVPQTSRGEIPAKNHFEDPTTCLRCHTTQHAEWKGSMMHYSAESPVFQAFELTTRKLTGRFGAHDAQNPTFCLNCHSPTAAYQNEMLALKKSQPTVEVMSPLSKQGIHCTMCHSVREPDLTDNQNKGLLGDGIANASFIFFPFTQWVGPTTTDPLPEANDYHADGFWPEKASSDYLTSSKFCGSCHNVHVPNTPDTVTKKGFQKIENLYTEWFEGPYNSNHNPHGKPVSCTDCHMSLYGAVDPKTGKRQPPGTFPTHRVATGFNRERKHALHSFTAVSVPLIGDEAKFPNQFSKELDQFGFPVGQEQRRQQMLGVACEIEISKLPALLEPTSTEIPLEVIVTNTGTGHRVPSGFSQEREVWLEVVVTDSNKKTVYESGRLHDSPHPETGETTVDGRTFDEDLKDVPLKIDPTTLEVAHSEMGPDFNLRPFRNLGLPTFNNAFLRKKTETSYERVHFFTLANHIDNQRSLPMLTPVTVRYDIPLSEWSKKNPQYCGNLNVNVKLNYRTLPPKLLRALIQREPALLSESLIDRNPLVVMTQRSQFTRVCGLMPQPQGPSEIAGSFTFYSQKHRWLSFPTATSFDSATAACKQLKCALPTLSQYDSLGLANYVPKPGDNHDELWTERWAADANASSPDKATTYFFTGANHRLGSAPISGSGAVKLPHFCFCEEKR